MTTTYYRIDDDHLRIVTRTEDGEISIEKRISEFGIHLVDRLRPNPDTYYREEGYVVENLEEIRKLRLGARAKGKVYFPKFQKDWPWNFTAEVLGPVIIQHRSLGRLEVLQVYSTRHRDNHREYQSQIAFVDVKSRSIVRYVTLDRRGEVSCELIEPL